MSFPANLTTVTAVGGTQLHRARNARGWAERVWNQPSIFGASGTRVLGVRGQARLAARPALPRPDDGGRLRGGRQHPGLQQGLRRLGHRGGHQRVGAAGRRRLRPGRQRRPPARPAPSTGTAPSLFDVTAGNNVLGATPGQVCGDDYLCAAKPGYDSPTGLGTPDGTGAF